MDRSLARLIPISAPKGKRSAVRRPGWVKVTPRAGFSVANLPERTSFKRRYINTRRLPLRRCRENNLFAVGRPARQRRLQMRNRELKALASIRPRSENRSFGNGHIGYPLLV